MEAPYRYTVELGWLEHPRDRWKQFGSSYIQEHIDGESDILVHKEDPGLIRVKIQSRHISSKQYILWIKFSESAITAWYCKCRAGARVVGVCSHIASVIWFLGYARHRDCSTYGVRNWGEYLEDAYIVDGSDSSSDEGIIEEWQLSFVLSLDFQRNDVLTRKTENLLLYFCNFLSHLYYCWQIRLILVSVYDIILLFYIFNFMQYLMYADSRWHMENLSTVF